MTSSVRWIPVTAACRSRRNRGCAMSAINTSRSGRGARREGGVYAVEFSLVALIFFVFVFGTIELSRAMYLFNTLQEVTRRAAAAAAVASPNDSGRRQQIR